MDFYSSFLSIEYITYRPTTRQVEMIQLMLGQLALEIEQLANSVVFGLLSVEGSCREFDSCHSSCKNNCVLHNQIEHLLVLV